MNFQEKLSELESLSEVFGNVQVSDDIRKGALFFDPDKMEAVEVIDLRVYGLPLFQIERGKLDLNPESIKTAVKDGKVEEYLDAMLTAVDRLNRSGKSSSLSSEDQGYVLEAAKLCYELHGMGKPEESILIYEKIPGKSVPDEVYFEELRDRFHSDKSEVVEDAKTAIWRILRTMGIKP